MPITNEDVEAMIEAECQLLGAILIQASVDDDHTIDEVRQVVMPENFHLQSHTRIYRAMLACDKPPNQVVVAHKMSELRILEEGDISYLSLLISGCAMSWDYPEYARVVADFAEKRRELFFEQREPTKARYKGFDV